MPEEVGRIYFESLKAFNAGAPILTSAGLRALVEGVCKEQGSSGKDLKAKIDDLVTKGVLSRKEADVLHLHRFLGNDAVHDLVAPPPGELEAALDILEHLLQTIYVLDEKAATVKEGRDKRKKP